MNHGLDHTLDSYGADYAVMEQLARRPSPARIKELVNDVPDVHLRVLPHPADEHRGARPVHRARALGRVRPRRMPRRRHARIRTDHRLHHRVLWECFDDAEINMNKAWKCRGFFGHTPVINYGRPDLHGQSWGSRWCCSTRGVAPVRSGD